MGVPKQWWEGLGKEVSASSRMNASCLAAKPMQHDCWLSEMQPMVPFRLYAGKGRGYGRLSEAPPPLEWMLHPRLLQYWQRVSYACKYHIQKNDMNSSVKVMMSDRSCPEELMSC